MSETYTPQLKLGTVGWEVGFERSGFFPEDLPEDWRLTYLSNEVDLVAIPLAGLDGVEQEDIEEWAEDTHEQFGFFLLVSAQTTVEQQEAALQLLSPLGEKLLGVIASQASLSLEEDSGGAYSLQYDGEVAWVEVAGELPPMAMRQLIEQLSEIEVDTLLFVPGAGLIANLANAETIASLLGSN